MAVRTPVYFDGTDIKQMSTAQIDAIKRQAKYQYSLNPSVSLSYAASGGNLGTLNDTRNTSSSTFSDVTSFSFSSGSANADFININPAVTVGNAHIDETKATSSYSVVDSNNIKFPCYLDGSNDVQPMTDSDFIDTFIKPALQSLDTTDTTTDSFSGIYHIQTTSTYSGSTLVNASPIFIDTRNDGLTSGVNQTADQPTNVTSYYLYLKDGDSTEHYDIPLHVYDSTGDVYTPDSAAFGEVLQNMMRYCSVFVDSCRIDYAYTSGTQRGVSITNTELNSRVTSTLFVNADDYRSQAHPAGTAVTINTYYLGLTIT